MPNRVTTLKTPAPGRFRDAGQSVRGVESLMNLPETEEWKHLRVPPESVNIAGELDVLHSMLSHILLEDALDAKIEDSFMEARVACALAQPDREAVGEALNRALKTACRCDDFQALLPSLRPHVQRAVAWLGWDWHRILAVVA